MQQSVGGTGGMISVFVLREMDFLRLAKSTEFPSAYVEAESGTEVGNAAEAAEVQVGERVAEFTSKINVQNPPKRAIKINPKHLN